MAKANQSAAEVAAERDSEVKANQSAAEVAAERDSKVKALKADVFDLLVEQEKVNVSLRATLKQIEDRKQQKLAEIAELEKEVTELEKEVTELEKEVTE